MNKGFGIIEFAIATFVVGALISGTVTIEKVQDKKLAVEVQVHPEQLKTGVAEYTNYND